MHLKGIIQYLWLVRAIVKRSIFFMFPMNLPVGTWFDWPGVGDVAVVGVIDLRHVATVGAVAQVGVLQI